MSIDHHTLQTAKKILKPISNDWFFIFMIPVSVFHGIIVASHSSTAIALLSKAEIKAKACLVRHSFMQQYFIH
jgi:hypothetical protein